MDEIDEQEEEVLEVEKSLPKERALLKGGRALLYYGTRAAVAYCIANGFLYLTYAANPLAQWSKVAQSGMLMLFLGFFLVFFLQGDADV